jgi:UDP-N-acetylmuramoyl-L-alanyl-D-glutamate--2,6-diaminopimelate ligase
MAAHAALQTAAVTGTNGKTTTVSMIDAIVAATGETNARVCTLGSWVGDEPIVADTPTQEFLGAVERSVERGVRTIAIEVTSKALAGGLAKRWRPKVAVFTNITRDHLDMHGSPEAYLASKAQLFMALPPGGVAVLNADDPASELIREVILPGVVVRYFSTDGAPADLAAREVVPSSDGTLVSLAPSTLADALGGEIALGVVGAVHAKNALAAALAVDALGYDADSIRRGLEAFAGVAGRFEIVGRAPLVVVDYAHTPDGLDGTLHTARELVGKGGRLICVFGCGGDRDRGKRPTMGELADRLADVVVLTNDNPRTESPERIAAEIRTGAPSPAADWTEQLDRRAAIDHAVNIAGAADVVVIAGKGHEAVQIVGDTEIPFSDVEVAREAIAADAPD